MRIEGYTINIGWCNEFISVHTIQFGSNAKYMYLRPL